MKSLKRAISVILVIAILMVTNIGGVSATVNTSVPPFKDVKLTDWYCTAVFRMLIYGRMSGYPDKTFKPQKSITRAEFVTALGQVFFVTDEGWSDYQYSDTKNHWADVWIKGALKADIIDEATNFYPNRAITRKEAVEMICRSLKLSEDKIMVSPYQDVTEDVGYSNTAYKEYLMRGSQVDGKLYFNPSRELKRCEAAEIFSNLLYYQEDSVKYKTSKINAPTKDQVEAAAKAETQRYTTWKESVKAIPEELLNNTDGMIKISIYTGNHIRGTVYDSYKYLRDNETYLKDWGSLYGMNESEMIKELVKVGSNYANIYANANYKKIDTFTDKLQSMLDLEYTQHTIQDDVNKVKSNTVVKEGKFITSEGMLVYAEYGNPVLRGTLKYRYSSPTSTNILKSEIVGSTKKPSQIGVWYEQDFEIHFSPMDNGLKIGSFNAISDIRLSK